MKIHGSLATLVVVLLVPFYSGCNLIQRPKGSVVSASSFNHTGVSSNCASCHDTGKPYAAFPASGHTATNGADCSSCHNTASWIAGAGYSHTPQPQACIACHGLTGTHQNDVPPVPVGSPVKMDHSVAPGNGDCVTCHLASVPPGTDVPTLGWSGGVLSHTGITTCLACHVSERPPAPIGTPVKMDHSTAPGNGECATCHMASLKGGGTPTSWAGGVLSHTGISSCMSCHISELPPTTNYYPSTPMNDQSPGAFNHPATYGTECFSCHTVDTANIGVSWKAGYFDHQGNGLTTAQSTCTPCHVAHSHDQGTPQCLKCHNSTLPTPNANGNYGGNIGGAN